MLSLPVLESGLEIFGPEDMEVLEGVEVRADPRPCHCDAPGDGRLDSVLFCLP